MEPAPAAPPPPAELEALRSKQRFHERVVAASLLGVTLALAGVALFMLRHLSLVQHQSAGLRQIVREYESNNAPLITRFVADLEDFARKNPDFAPVLGKYVQRPDHSPLPPFPAPPPPR